MSPGRTRRHWASIVFDWLAGSCLASLFFLLIGVHELGGWFWVFPSVVLSGQAYVMRRHVTWWVWLMASVAGAVSAVLFHWYFIPALGLTVGLFQAACLCRRSLVLALLWPLLAFAGWIAGIFVCHSVAPAMMWPWVLLVMVTTQALVVAPLVVVLERHADIRARRAA